MINGLSVLAFIPARSGSKSLPDKNILKLNGKELVAYTIEAAINSKVCDEVVVSTDSSKIAHIAQKCGANVPFLRPKKLAQDDSKMIDVILHAINWFENKQRKFDTFLFLQPTSPLRNSNHITEAFEIYFNKKADVIISVNETDCIPDRLNTLPNDKRMNQFVNLRTQHLNRQEFGKYYQLNGAINIADWNVLKDKKTWFVDNSFAYIMDRKYAVDIDSKLDFYFVECLLKSGYVD